MSYAWNDVYMFAQDEWRAGSNLTFTLGLRYELPGNAVDSLVALNRPILEAAGGDERFALTPVPRADTDNLQPRIGFNWNARTRNTSVLGFLTGGDKFVVRGGYARTHDYQFRNPISNIANSFPFTAAISLPPVTQSGVTGIINAFPRLPAAPVSGDPLLFTRTIVADDYRAPVADQFSVSYSGRWGTTSYSVPATLAPVAAICSRASREILDGPFPPRVRIPHAE